MESFPENAYQVRFGQADEVPPQNAIEVLRYGPVVVRQRPIGRAGALHVVEDERHTLLLRGHLYCESTRSLEPAENLAVLLRRLAEGQTLADALSAVAGGMFALFVVDRTRGVLHATVDRLGFMPVYYRRSSDQVTFTNNQFLFQDDATLVDTAACEYLKYGHLPFSHSLFESVSRIQPGEIVTASADPELRVGVEARAYRAFLPPARRIRTPEEGAEVLASALDRYFSRLGDGRGVAGLSGGYDSRVIAAYTAEHDIALFNFGNPASSEVRIARQVADRLGKPIEYFRIPDDAVARHGGRYKAEMLVPDSFEHAHVFELVDRVAAAEASYAVDGFLGDSIVGSGYYYTLGKTPREVLANLRLKNGFESAVRGVEAYVDLLYGNKRAVPDAALCGLMEGGARESIRASARRLAEAHLAWCPTHEDMAESLTHATRGRCLIAGGPVAVGALTPSACPFIDHAVFDAAMSCAKGVRAGDRLYNAFWRQRFPALADIPKGNTGGCPRDGDTAYRSKHAVNALFRRSIEPRLKRWTSGGRDRSDNYSSLEGYLACESNRVYLRELSKRSGSRLPPRVAAALLPGYSSGTLSPAVTLRLGTLMAYLG